MPTSKRLTRPSSGSPASSSRAEWRPRPIRLTTPARRCGALLEVDQVFAVHAGAGEGEGEGDGADEEADDGRAEGVAEAFGEGRDVAFAERREAGGERDQRPHQAQRRAGADEEAGAVEAALDVQLVAGEGALGAVARGPRRRGRRRRAAAAVPGARAA